MDKVNTPDEIVDIVNEQDEIIGEATKGVVNSNPQLIHREVFVLLFDEAKRVLLQQRSRLKKLGPLMWSLSAAGHVPKGMNVEVAAHKELMEELGFDTKLFFIEKNLTRLPHETRFVYSFIGLYKGETIVPDPHEVEQIKILTQEEFNKLIESGIEVGESTIILAKRLWQNEFDSYLT